jgi:hypothetical protein
MKHNFPVLKMTLIASLFGLVTPPSMFLTTRGSGVPTGEPLTQELVSSLQGPELFEYLRSNSRPSTFVEDLNAVYRIGLEYWEFYILIALAIAIVVYSVGLAIWFTGQKKAP